MAKAKLLRAAGIGGIERRGQLFGRPAVQPFHSFAQRVAVRDRRADRNGALAIDPVALGRLSDLAHGHQVVERNQGAGVVSHVKRFQILGLRALGVAVFQNDVVGFAPVDELPDPPRAQMGLQGPADIGHIHA